MASLFEAIVQQNLSVLTRGNTLRPVVLLLGGPNTYIKGMQRLLEAQHPQDLGGAQLPAARRRGARRPDQDVPTTRSTSPPSARCEFGKDEDDERRQSTSATKSSSGTSTSAATGREAEEGRQRRTRQGRSRTGGVQAEVPAPRNSCPRTFKPGEVVEGFMGIDGGSTSTKAVLLRRTQAPHPGEELPALQGQSHRRHHGDVRRSSTRQVDDQGADAEDSGRRHHRIRQGHSEGRARRRRRAGGDRGAHRSRRCTSTTTSDVICDVGGQDIKLIILQERPREGFQAQHAVLRRQRLLPAIHRAGLRLPTWSSTPTSAFGAKAMPMFGYGCAVFMQSRHRRFPAPGLEAGRDHGRPVPTCCPRTSGCTFRRFPTSRRIGTTLPAAGRHAAQPGGGEGAGGFHRVALQGQGRRSRT